jgi:hypothetical protein
MKLGSISAQAGEKAFGFYKTGETHGRFPVHIPLHIVRGKQDGPTLVVQAGASGLEIEPALILPTIIKELDPSVMSGTLVMVPLMNTSGFEFEQVNSVYDDKHLNKVGRGNALGTVSEQLIDRYYQEVLGEADAIVEIRTGSQWSYDCYARVYPGGSQKMSTQLAVALGLEQVVIGVLERESMVYEAASDGKTVAVAHVGGGPRLRDHRSEDLERVRHVVLNAMIHLGILQGTPQHENSSVSVIEMHTVLMPTGERGFTFMDTSKRGKMVTQGEELGYVRHPFTGQVVERITASRDGIVIHAGASWPIPLETTVLAILGDLKEQITLK